MSHLHKGQYTDKDRLIAYINGFLWPLEILNEYADHGQTYYVEEIDKTLEPKASILAHLKDENYIISLDSKVNWEETFRSVGKEFFEAGLLRLKFQLANSGMVQSKSESVFRDTWNFDLLLDKFIELMSELLSSFYAFYEVSVDWNNGAFYECYHRDFLVDNDKGRFFIHFGVSD